MGFYIHSCQKMIYKGKFRPSDLLCPQLKTCECLLFARPRARSILCSMSDSCPPQIPRVRFLVSCDADLSGGG